MSATSFISEGFVTSRLQCNSCRQGFVVAPTYTVAKLRAQMRKEGWTRDKAGDYCARCSRGRLS